MKQRLGTDTLCLLNLPKWQDHMRRQNRRTGAQTDFVAIIAQLEVASI